MLELDVAAAEHHAREGAEFVAEPAALRDPVGRLPRQRLGARPAADGCSYPRENSGVRPQGSDEPPRLMLRVKIAFALAQNEMRQIEKRMAHRVVAFDVSSAAARASSPRPACRRGRVARDQALRERGHGDGELMVEQGSAPGERASFWLTMAECGRWRGR